MAQVLANTPLGVMTITLNDDEIRRSVPVLERRFQEGIEKGLADAGFFILRRAVMDVPTVPLDTGALRGSGSVHVDGQYKGDSRNWVKTKVGRTGRIDVPEPIDDDIPNEAKTDEHIAVVGYNKDYAEETHEDTTKTFHESGAGNYYLMIAVIDASREKVPSLIASALQKKLSRS